MAAEHEHEHEHEHGPDSAGDIVAAYIDRMNRGERFTPEAIRAEHPDLAEAILDHLETFVDLSRETEETGEPERLGSLGDYVLKRRLGRGGMGVVYEAWEGSMDRRVALKVLPAAIAADDRAVTRFVREARAAGRLNHPNLVSIYGMGVKEQVPYFAMEYVDGETLAEILLRLKDAPEDAGTPFGPSRADQEYYLRLARAFADAADGLQHAHSKGVIHRDIKPSNLILDKDGRLRILDFGLARLEGQESLTLSGDFLGTPQYMSPEQARRQKVEVDHRTDVYSLGATLYEAISGRPPFQGKDHADTLSRIIADDPVEPRRLNARVPEALGTIVLKCLRKDAGDRYGTAEAMGQDLRRFVRGDAIEARSESAWDYFWRRVWRKRAKVALGAVLAGLCIALVLLLAARARERQLRREEGYERRVLDAVLKLQSGPWSSGVLRNVDPEEYFYLDTDPSAGAVDPRLQAERQALAELDRAMEDVPSRPDARYWRSRAMLALGREAEALEGLRHLSERHPGFVPAQALQVAVLKARGDAGWQRGIEILGRSGQSEWAKAWIRAHEASRNGEWGVAAEAYEALLDMEAGNKPAYVGSAAEVLVGRAVARIALKDLDGAIEDLAAAEYQWRGWPEPTLLKAKAYGLKGEWERAERELLRLHGRSRLKDEVAVGAISIYLSLGEPDREEPWVERIEVEALRERMRCGVLVDLGRFEEAREAGRRALELNPRDPLVHQWLAWGYLHGGEGDEREAERLLRESLRDNPRIFRTRAHLADLLHRRKDFDAALAEAHAAADAGCSLGYLISGVILKDLGRRDEALEAFLEACRRAPRNAFYPNNLGHLYLGLGRQEDAWAAFRRALELSPGLSWAWLGEGQILEAQGKLPEALEAYRAACRGYPRDGLSHVFLAGALLKTGSVKEALAACAGGFERTPELSRLHETLAQVLARHDSAGCEAEAERVAEVLEGRLRKGKESPLLLKSLARIWRRIGDLERARSCARRALDLRGPADPAAAIVLAEVEEAAGDAPRAVRALEEARRFLRLEGAVPAKLDALRRAILPRLASYESADAALAARDSEEIVREGAEWRFFRGRSEPSTAETDWTDPAFDDGGWERSESGFGYGDGDDRTHLEDMQQAYTTVYLRREVELIDPDRYESLVLIVTADDGFVAYWNGEEIGRQRAPGKPGERPFHDAVATMSAPEPPVPFDVAIGPSLCPPGRNLLAIQGLNASTGSSDFTLIPVLKGLLPQSIGRGRDLLEGFEAEADTEEDRRIAAYLEGRILQMEGQHAEAAEVFDALTGEDPERPEPLLRLAGCLRAAGDAEVAAKRLRAGLEAGLGSGRSLWDLWIEICFVDLKLGPKAVLDVFPHAPSAAASDLMWLLDRLSAGDSIRIDCGGGEVTTPSGRAWGPDRFFARGFRHLELDGERLLEDPPPYGGDIALTEDDPLYRTNRWFLAGESRPLGYRIPLPPGKYRVALGFAEVWFREAGARVFDVLLEGKPWLVGYEPLQAGFAAAVKETEEAVVRDGFLDIEFVGVKDSPMVSAIEVERAD